MYERSAIVLERYFENLLEYRREGNLRDNFYFYCELVEKLEKYQVNYQKEFIAIQDYNETLKKIKQIQLTQEKLYKRSAKLEYNRNLLFNNLDGKVEDIEKCIEKIEAEVDKNNEDMKSIKVALVNTLGEFNEKKFELSKCKRYKKMAENDYNEIYEKARANFDEIDEENVATIKAFAKFDNTEDIIATLQENGSGEKIPFNEGVIESATILALDIAKKEAASYLTIYDKMVKLMADIDTGSAKIELHKKYLRNEKAKIDFIIAVKEYMTQFLDYERMTIIHGRKSHNRLMSEACENFNADTVQISNLFELLLRETTNKATKKAYKELYNQTYLTEIKEKEEKFKREKNRVNLNTATLINSNYWRIEGVKVIYTVFYKNVSEVFGRDVEEFDIPKEFDENPNEDSEDYDGEEVIEDNVEEEVVEEKKEEKKKETPKMPFQVRGSLDIDEFEEENDESEENDDDDDDVFKKFKKMNKKSSENDDDEDDDLIIPKSTKFDFDDEEEVEIEDEEDEDEEDVDYEVEDEEDIDEDEIDIFGNLDDEEDDSDEDEEEDIFEVEVEDEDESEENDEEVLFDDEEEEESIIETTTKKKTRKEIEIPDDESDEIKELLRRKIQSYDNLVDNMVDDFDDSEEEEFDIFGEKYQKIDLTDSDVIPAKARRGEKSEKEESKEKDAIFFENIRKAQKPKVEENEEDEVSFFGEIKKITSKRQSKIEDEDIQDTKVGVFGKIKKMGNKKKKSSDEDVW